MITLLVLAYQGLMSRLAGNGFGQKWGVSWLPELLFALPFGLAAAYATSLVTNFWVAAFVLFVGWACSFIFMQSGTWMFLQWTEHEPNSTRKSTLKPLVDWIAARFGYKLGDEGYSWIAAGVKGFLIGLPVGGIPLAILWPFGYEIGSHAKGRVEQFGIDPHAVSEVAAGVGAGLSIVLFLAAIGA